MNLDEHFVCHIDIVHHWSFTRSLYVEYHLICLYYPKGHPRCESSLDGVGAEHPVELSPLGRRALLHAHQQEPHHQGQEAIVPTVVSYVLLNTLSFLRQLHLLNLPLK